MNNGNLLSARPVFAILLCLVITEVLGSLQSYDGYWEESVSLK